MTTLCATSDNNLQRSSTLFFARKCFSLQVLCKTRRKLTFVLAAVLAAVLFPIPPFARAEQLPLPFPELVSSENASTFTLDSADKNAPPRFPSEEPNPLRDDARVVGRVLRRIYEAECQELNPHFRSDYRISWCLTLFLHRGDGDTAQGAMNLAWRAVLNCRPEEVWPNVVANRKQRLGAEFADWYTSDGLLKPEPAFGGDSSPRKPVQGVRDPRQRRTA